jgi:ubiquinone/menaquinone biosynthesis C-methylase UbiE
MTQQINKLYELLMCPDCKCGVEEKGSELVCTNKACGKTYQKIGNMFCFLPKAITKDDVVLSSEKWDEFYADRVSKKKDEELYQDYLRENFTIVSTELDKYKKIDQETVFLEIGCGQMHLALALSSKCKLVIGIDISIEALRSAQAILDAHGVTNYLLVQADINQIPLKDNCVDIIYGGGVIEHFRDTLPTLKESCRVLRKGGISYNTVPMLNIGSLTYRQLWGNIPNVPLVRELYEFVHTKILGGKHLRFGYELSFLPGTLMALHKKAGFVKTQVGHFPTNLIFEFVPIKQVRKLFIYLAETSPLFWPMVKAVGTK